MPCKNCLLSDSPKPKDVQFGIIGLKKETEMINRVSIFCFAVETEWLMEAQTVAYDLQTLFSLWRSLLVLKNWDKQMFAW